MSCQQTLTEKKTVPQQSLKEAHTQSKEESADKYRGTQQRRKEGMGEKRENVKYAGFPLKQHVPQSLIITWRKNLDGGIT